MQWKYLDIFIIFELLKGFVFQFNFECDSDKVLKLNLIDSPSLKHESPSSFDCYPIISTAY